MKAFSNFISVILHPTMMVTYAAAIYLFLLPSDFQFADPTLPLKIIGLFFISTVIMPVVFLFVMVRFGIISSMQIEQQNERNWPLLQTAIIYVGAYYAVHSKNFPAFMQLFILGAVLGILISLVVNLRWKISLHMIGIGGLCGGFAALLLLQQNGNPMLLSACFLSAGLLGTVRLYLNAHTPLQILGGFLTGFTIQFLLMRIMLN